MKMIVYMLAAILLCIPGGGKEEQTHAEVHFKTEDNIKIFGRMQYPGKLSKPVPVIILIHQGGSSSEEWLELPLWKQLLDEGFALLAYDVRGHGQSENDGGSMGDLFENPDRAPLDLMAAIDYLKKDPHINAEKIGIIGSSMGANLACAASANDDFPVQAVVSMSAKTADVQKLTRDAEDLEFNNAFFIASEEENYGMRSIWARELYKLTSGKKKMAIGKGQKHGSSILRSNKSFNKDIVDWFEVNF